MKNLLTLGKTALRAGPLFVFDIFLVVPASDLKVSQSISKSTESTESTAQKPCIPPFIPGLWPKPWPKPWRNTKVGAITLPSGRLAMWKPASMPMPWQYVHGWTERNLKFRAKQLETARTLKKSRTSKWISGKIPSCFPRIPMVQNCHQQLLGLTSLCAAQIPISPSLARDSSGQLER